MLCIHNYLRKPKDIACYCIQSDRNINFLSEIKRITKLMVNSKQQDAQEEFVDLSISIDTVIE